MCVCVCARVCVCVCVCVCWGGGNIAFNSAEVTMVSVFCDMELNTLSY